MSVAETYVLASLAVSAITGEVIGEARRLVAAHRIRSLDALHVGTAILIARRAHRRGRSFAFLTADKRQAAVATVVLGPEQIVLVPPWR
jgi:hypothetical protein